MTNDFFSNPPPLGEVKSEAYARLLWHEGRGFPLWDPNLNGRLPDEYKKRGTQVGDVGFLVKRGAFEYEFNIFLPSDHPWNRRVPDGFRPMEIKPEIVIEKFGKLFLTSHNAEGHREARPLSTGGEELLYHIKCGEDREGAALIVPEGGIKEDIVDVDEVRRYVAKHAIEWYRHFRQMKPVNGSLHVVTGIDKTAVWSAATITDADPPAELRLTVNTQQDINPTQSEAKTTYFWSGRDGPGEVRHGPLPDRSSRVVNQGIFLRSFCIQLQHHEWETALRPPSRGGIFGLWDRLSRRPAAVTVRSPFNLTEVENPTRHITTYLLRKMPRARLAIVHQSDWQPLLSKREAVPEMDDLSLRIEKYFIIEMLEDGNAVFLKRRI